MYCISCGVKLADSERKCPLCGLEVYHPKLQMPAVESQYPPKRYPRKEVSAWGKRLIVLVAMLLPLMTVILCDFPVNGRITWSGYVIGAIVLLYVMAMLPRWFSKPNLAIFIAADLGLAAMYLHYINWTVGGAWFMTFALPVTIFTAAVATSVATMMRYISRGRLFIFGGGAVACGLFMPVMEMLMVITFPELEFLGWGFFPMGGLVLFGGLLIFFGVCRPAREAMERKFFI